MFSLQENQRTRGWNRFCQKSRDHGEVAQTMFAHVSKCKTITEKEKRKRMQKNKQK
jgi:hypothetical protein